MITNLIRLFTATYVIFKYKSVTKSSKTWLQIKSELNEELAESFLCLSILNTTMKSSSFRFSHSNLFYLRFLSCKILTLAILVVTVNHCAAMNKNAAVKRKTTFDLYKSSTVKFSATYNKTVINPELSVPLNHTATVSTFILPYFCFQLADYSLHVHWLEDLVCQRINRPHVKLSLMFHAHSQHVHYSVDLRHPKDSGYVWTILSVVWPHVKLSRVFLVCS